MTPYTLLELKSCDDCLYQEVAGEPFGLSFCTAPQLKIALDCTEGHQNHMAFADSCRDFKMACGHRAQWFVSAV